MSELPEGGSHQTASADRHEALGLDAERLLDLYRQMSLARAVDRRMWVLNRQGKAPFAISGQGHEAAQVAVAAALRPGQDWVVPYYRDLALCLAIGMTAREFMLAVFGRRDDPTSGGRQMPSHFGERRLRILSGSSPVATQVVHAAGIAYASKVRGLDEVTLTCLGEGSTSEGDWHEAMNFAGIHRLPLICVVEDNDYAISVPHRLQMAVTSVADRAAGYGMAGEAVDGGDVIAVYQVMRAAVERARSGGGPTLVAAKVNRLTAHSSDDDQRRYRPAEELEAMVRQEPLDRYRFQLLEAGVLAEDADEAIQRECVAEVEDAVAHAEAAPEPSPEDLLRDVYSED